MVGYCSTSAATAATGCLMYPICNSHPGLTCSTKLIPASAVAQDKKEQLSEAGVDNRDEGTLVACRQQITDQYSHLYYEDT